MKTRKNKFNVEWNYAKSIWTARKAGLPDPEVPSYNVWEVDENSGKEKLIKKIPCDVMNVVLPRIPEPVS